jgi:hypothetical protein
MYRCRVVLVLKEREDSLIKEHKILFSLLARLKVYLQKDKGKLPEIMVYRCSLRFGLPISGSLIKFDHEARAMPSYP